MKPTPKKPRIIIAQVAGSGTAEDMVAENSRFSLVRNPFHAALA
jgi:hypothetical protein